MENKILERNKEIIGRHLATQQKWVVIYSLRFLLVYTFLLHKVLGESMLLDIKGKINYYFMLKLNVCVMES